MRIWIDLDGVLASFTGSVLDVARELWPGQSIPCDYQPSDWDYTDLFTKDDWDAIWERIKTKSDFWLAAKPIEANVLALQTWLAETEHQVFYITSRCATGGVSAHEQSARWLMKQKVYPSFARLIVTKTPDDKRAVIEQYSIEMGIDDLPRTVIHMNMLSWHHCWLHSQPWNSTSTLSRVSSLQEFLDIVDSAARDHQGT